MPKLVVTVTELFADPTGNVISTAEVFKQSCDDLDLKKFARDLNKPQRAKRGRPPTAAK